MENIDMSRQGATSGDSEFTLTIEDALALYAAAGIPRTPRSIQRYCAKQHLASRRIETEFGEKYLITRASVEKHIAYIKEVMAATSRDLPRPVATEFSEINSDDKQRQEGTTGSDVQRPVAITVAAENKDDKRRQIPATSSDQPRPVATAPTGDDKYLSLLERENEFLRGEIAVKNTQISELTERARETNHLVAGLQNLLRPLLGKPEERPDSPQV
ncbi:hypothetical protein [Bradyrhizobium manausense]|uniref:Uncharacterized protein n=1 Tax=Bradyrhizobium manausense TaxID=989370 RepID=A0A0R3DQF9_9BRAD|nr:hypothetical protein [Bradyrhizobium manausense]KRQ09135.1 hypothetical protein AOQ71_21125 [Bradyrhizobium manausense]